MLTRKELELGIIRCAERWPDRVGPQGWGVCHAHCIIGQVQHDAGKCCEWVSEALDEVAELASNAVALNDAGTRWGDIPRLLGLVPGEAPICQPVASVEPESPVLEVVGG